MAATGGFSVRIGVVDGASRQIEAINKRLAALRAPFERLQGSLGRLHRLSGLAPLIRGFQSLGTMVANVGRSIASVIPGLGAITGAATIAGVAKLVTNWSDFGAKLGDTAQRLGLSTTALHGLQGAARLAGVDAQALTSGLDNLGDILQDAVAGRAPEAMRLFNALGIKIHDAAHRAKPAGEVFEDIAERLAKLNHSPRIQEQIAKQLGLEALLPLIRKGKAGIQEARRESERYGLINAEGARQAEEMQQAQTRLALAFEGLGFAIAEKVGPVLTPLLTKFSLWIAANREWIATNITDYVRRFGEWVRKFNDEGGLQKIIDTAKEWATKIDDLVQSIGGWQNALIGLFALWTAAKVAPIIGAIGGVAGVLVRLATALASLGSGPAAAALATLTSGGLLTALAAIGIPAAVLAAIMQLQPRTAETADQQRRNWRDRGSGAPAPTGNRAEMEKKVYEGYIARGLSPDEAAAMTSNWMAESGTNINAHNKAGGGTGAHGGHQWRGPRAEAFKARFGYYPSDPRATMEQQQDFAVDEYRRSYQGRVRADAGPGADAAELGRAVSKIYEAHGDQGKDAERGLEAERILRRQRGAAPAPGVNAVTSPQPQRVSLNGSANVNIALAGFPQGTTTSASTSGIFEPPAITMGMPGYAAA